MSENCVYVFMCLADHIVQSKQNKYAYLKKTFTRCVPVQPMICIVHKTSTIQIKGPTTDGFLYKQKQIIGICLLKSSSRCRKKRNKSK